MHPNLESELYPALVLLYIGNKWFVANRGKAGLDVFDILTGFVRFNHLKKKNTHLNIHWNQL